MVVSLDLKGVQKCRIGISTARRCEKLDELVELAMWGWFRYLLYFFSMVNSEHVIFYQSVNNGVQIYESLLQVSEVLGNPALFLLIHDGLLTGHHNRFSTLSSS